MVIENSCTALVQAQPAPHPQLLDGLDDFVPAMLFSACHENNHVHHNGDADDVIFI